MLILTKMPWPGRYSLTKTCIAQTEEMQVSGLCPVRRQRSVHSCGFSFVPLVVYVYAHMIWAMLAVCERSCFADALEDVRELA